MAEEKKDFTPIIEFLLDRDQRHGWNWRHGVNPTIWAKVMKEEGVPLALKSMKGAIVDPDKGYELGGMANIRDFLMRALPQAIAAGEIPEDIKYSGKVPLVTDDEIEAARRFNNISRGIMKDSGVLTDAFVGEKGSKSIETLLGMKEAGDWMGKVLGEAMEDKDLSALFGPKVAKGGYLVRKKEKVIDSNGNETWEPEQAVQVGPGKYRNEWVMKHPKHSVDLLDFKSSFWKGNEGKGVEDAQAEYEDRMKGLLEDAITFKEKVGDKEYRYKMLHPYDVLNMDLPHRDSVMSHLYRSDRKAFPGIMDYDAAKAAADKLTSKAAEAMKKAKTEGAVEKALALEARANRVNSKLSGYSALKDAFLAYKKAKDDSVYVDQTTQEARDQMALDAAKRRYAASGGAALVKKGDVYTSKDKNAMYKDYKNLVKNMLSNKAPFNNLDNLIAQHGDIVTTPEFKKTFTRPEMRDIFFSGKERGLKGKDISKELVASALNYLNNQDTQRSIGTALESLQGPGSDTAKFSDVVRKDEEEK